jgi:hypothetical protein
MQSKTAAAGDVVFAGAFLVVILYYWTGKDADL